MVGNTSDAPSDAQAKAEQNIFDEAAGGPAQADPAAETITKPGTGIFSLDFYKTKDGSDTAVPAGDLVVLYDNFSRLTILNFSPKDILNCNNIESILQKQEDREASFDNRHLFYKEKESDPWRMVYAGSSRGMQIGVPVIDMILYTKDPVVGKELHFQPFAVPLWMELLGGIGEIRGKVRGIYDPNANHYDGNTSTAIKRRPFVAVEEPYVARRDDVKHPHGYRAKGFLTEMLQHPEHFLAGASQRDVYALINRERIGPYDLLTREQIAQDASSRREAFRPAPVIPGFGPRPAE